jgi:hypothetical protein
VKPLLHTEVGSRRACELVPAEAASPTPPAGTPEPPDPTPSVQPIPTAPIVEVTPSSNEIKTELQAAAEARVLEISRQELEERELQEREFRNKLDECLDNPNSRYCMLNLASWVYEQYGVDLETAAFERMDNPLGGKSNELELLSHQMVESWSRNPERTEFLTSLGMNQDDYWNYEPIYFSEIRRAYPDEYRDAQLAIEGRAQEASEFRSFLISFKKYINQSPGWSNE